MATLRLIDGMPAIPSSGPTKLVHSLAADFDASGTVNLDDADHLLRHIAGIPTIAPAWVFIAESDGSLTAGPAQQPGIPGPVTIEAPLPGSTVEVEIDLIGVLRGDVDGSWNPSRFGVGGE